MHHNNLVVLRGHVAGEPRRSTLPSGTTVYQLEITTRLDDGQASGAPVAWFDPRAEFVAGDDVVVLGHVHRRFFRTGGATVSRTEVVAHTVVRADRARDVRRLVARAAAALGPS